MPEAQLSLFDFITAAGETIPVIAGEPQTEKVATVVSSGFVSVAQKHLAENEPMFFQFKNKTLEEIDRIDNAQTKRFSNTDKFSLWCSLLWTAQTFALEKIYRELDERFLDDYSGKFWIREGDGKIHEARFDYAPSFNFKNPTRTLVPSPHIEFHTAKNSPITSTGYKSHFINCVPFADVSTMEEFIEFLVKEHFKVKADVSFSGSGEQDFIKRGH
jgi:hypothetical protein